MGKAIKKPKPKPKPKPVATIAENVNGILQAWEKGKSVKCAADESE